MTFFKGALSILMIVEIIVSVFIFYDADVRVESFIKQSIERLKNNKELVERSILRDAVAKQQAIQAHHIFDYLDAFKGPLNEGSLGKLKAFNNIFSHIYDNLDHNQIDIIRIYSKDGFLINRYIRGVLDNNSSILNYRSIKREEYKLNLIIDQLDYAFLANIPLKDSSLTYAIMEAGATATQYTRTFEDMTSARTILYLFHNNIPAPNSIPSFAYRDIDNFRIFMGEPERKNDEYVDFIAKALNKNMQDTSFDKVDFIDIAPSDLIAFYIPIKTLDGSLAGFFVQLADNAYLSQVRTVLISLWFFITFMLVVFLFLLYLADKKQNALSVAERYAASYKNVLDNSLSIVKFDSSFNITQVTNNVVKMFGIKREDFEGKSISELVNLSPDYKRLRESFFNNFNIIIGEKVHHNGIFPFMTLDNKEVFIQIHTVAINEIDDKRSFICILTNLTREYDAISALRIAEGNSEKLNRILTAYVNVSGSKIAVFNKQLKVEYTNLREDEKGITSLCYISPDLPCGNDCSCINGETAPHCKVVQVFKTGFPISYEEIDDEKDIYQNVSFIPIFNKETESDVLFVVYELRDIKNFILSQRELIEANNRERKLVLDLQSIVKDKEESNRRVIEANKAKNIFLANMSHEIRTPMNGIMGFLSLMKMCKMDDTAKGYLDIINSSSESLLSIINDILDFSKIESGKMELEYLPTNIVEAVENTISMHIARAEEKNINLFVFLDIDLPVSISIDIVKLRQVISNLLSNAIKFTPKGGVVEFSMRKLYKNAKNVRIYFEVKDSGVGVSEEALKTIFSPFSQADISTTRRFGGTGLGLSISKNILALMGSLLKVESKQGEGTTFSFEIVAEELLPPIAKPKFERSLIVESTMLEKDILNNYVNVYGYNVINQEGDTFYVPDENCRAIFFDSGRDLEAFKERFKNIKIENRNKDFKVIVFTNSYNKQAIDQIPGVDLTIIKPAMPYKLMELYESVTSSAFTQVSTALSNKFEGSVLVAEDNIVNQKLIEILLSKLGLKVAIASDGIEVVEKAKEDRFDLIFMDIHMPRKDGIEASKEIISLGIHTPIIALTANIVKEDIEQFLSVGMVEYLSKPINNDKLVEVLKKYLQ